MRALLLASTLASRGRRRGVAVHRLLAGTGVTPIVIESQVFPEATFIMTESVGRRSLDWVIRRLRGRGRPIGVASRVVTAGRPHSLATVAIAPAPRCGHERVCRHCSVSLPKRP